jgi:hypothetical protein
LSRDFARGVKRTSSRSSRRFAELGMVTSYPDPHYTIRTMYGQLKLPGRT